MKTVLQKLIYGNTIGRSTVFPIIRFLSKHWFLSSAQYWEFRYASNGNSGDGSYGRLANYKAKFLNEFIEREKIKSVIEFGCGDGNQLSLANYPSYIGFDVSITAIRKCSETFSEDKSKSFFIYDPFAFVDSKGLFKAGVCLSLDVIYHLVEDSVFYLYMEHLFGCASNWVVIYSSNRIDKLTLAHVRHRKFTDYVALNFPDWKLILHTKNEYAHVAGKNQTSAADFYVYKKL